MLIPFLIILLPHIHTVVIEALQLYLHNMEGFSVTWSSSMGDIL